MAIRIKVNSEGAVQALGQFLANTTAGKRVELMRVIGNGQLVSIYKTFAEEGSPSGSWPQLSDVSLRWGKHKAGNKLLIQSGRLRNSIRVEASADRVVIGTNVRYAGVHQFGFHGTQSVKGYSYSRSVSSRDKWGQFKIVNKAGKQQTVRRKIASGVAFVTVKAFTRNLNIPARPYLVFRPEDPARIQQEVDIFYRNQASAAGLRVN